MSNKNEIITSDPSANVPAFLQGEELDTGLLSQYVQFPRLLVVQGQSKAPLDEFDKGSLVVMPLKLCIAPYDKKRKEGPPLSFVPCYFFPSWATYNPRSIKESQGAIRASSYDPACDIAIKSRNPNTRKERCPEANDPDDNMMSHLELMNYVIVFTSLPPEHPLYREPVMMTLRSGEYITATAFNSLVKSRRRPMRGCQFMMQVGDQRVNAKGDWYGADFFNPTEESGVSPWAESKEDYDYYTSIHDQAKDLHQRNLIDMSDLEEEANAVGDEEEETAF